MTAVQDHGKYSTYVGGCRCPECTEANRLYHTAQRARRRANPALADAAGHGKATTYANYSCRCDACRAANAAHKRAERARNRGRA